MRCGCETRPLRAYKSLLGKSKHTASMEVQTASFSLQSYSDRPCPPAPKKRRLSRSDDWRSLSDACSTARDALLDMPDDERASSALPHIPRHVLQPVLLSYCHWLHDGTTQPDFERLLEVAPCLDAEIRAKAANALPHAAASWQEWDALTRDAIENSSTAGKLSQAVQNSIVNSARRTLEF